MAAPAPGAPCEPILEAARIYRVYFHGPAYRVIERAWWDGDRMIGEMAQDLPNDHYPPEQPMVLAPRLIELCLQTAGLWELSVQGQDHMSLPQYIKQIRVGRAPDRGERRLYAVVTPLPDHEGFDAEVVTAAGNRYLQLRGYRTVAMPDSIDTEPLKLLQPVLA